MTELEEGEMLCQPLLAPIHLPAYLFTYLHCQDADTLCLSPEEDVWTQGSWLGTAGAHHLPALAALSCVLFRVVLTVGVSRQLHQPGTPGLFPTAVGRYKDHGAGRALAVDTTASLAELGELSLAPDREEG